MHLLTDGCSVMVGMYGWMDWWMYWWMYWWMVTTGGKHWCDAGTRLAALLCSAVQCSSTSSPTLPSILPSHPPLPCLPLSRELSDGSPHLASYSVILLNEDYPPSPPHISKFYIRSSKLNHTSTIALSRWSIKHLSENKMSGDRESQSLFRWLTPSLPTKSWISKSVKRAEAKHTFSVPLNISVSSLSKPLVSLFLKLSTHLAYLYFMCVASLHC